MAKSEVVDVSVRRARPLIRFLELVERQGSRAEITAGLLESPPAGGKSAQEIHPESLAPNEDGTTGAPLTIAEIGSFHEFGLGNNPERSFIRAWFDENEKMLENWVRSALARSESQADLERNLDRVALRVQGAIQKRMSEGIPPALSPAYLQRKGADKAIPLIDTGVLRSAITAKAELMLK